MQRDLKIGLSLAVLLIGVVGALFFRRDNSDAVDIPELKMAWEIDQRIMHRKGNSIPYMVDSPPAAKSEALEKSEVFVSSSEGISPSETRSIEKIAALGSPSENLPISLPPNPDNRHLDGQLLASEIPEPKDLPHDPDLHITPRSETESAASRNGQESDELLAGMSSARGENSPRVDDPPRIDSTSRVDYVEALESQTLPRRWSNIREDRSGDATENSNWKSIEPADRRDRTRTELEPIPLPPVLHDSVQEESPAPKATRKLKPIPIAQPGKFTQSGKFSRPERTPFTTRPPSTTLPSDDRDANGSEDLRHRTSNPDREQVSSGEKTYEVRSGDSLEEIARKHYGHRGMVDRILEANKDVIDDPNRISVGMRIRLP